MLLQHPDTHNSQPDASIKGLGAVLIQDGVPVYFASRTLTHAERTSWNLEDEPLATIWGMEYFSHFLFGEEFTLETDQKPLVIIYKKKIDDIYPRITKLINDSLVFRPFKVIHLIWKKNCYADPLSRVSPMLPRRGEEDTDIIMVNELTSVVPVPGNNLDEIRAETAKDPVFMKMIKYVMQGWPDSRSKVSKEVKPHSIHHMEITVEDGILLKMNRIIISPWLRPANSARSIRTSR